MKAVALAIAVLGSCVLAAHAGFDRRLLQAPTANDCPTIFDIAEQAGLTQLLTALQLDELEPSLDNNTVYPLTYTVFAPNNEAFEDALAALGTTLDDLDMSGQLDDILQYHFLITPYNAATLDQLGTVGTNFRNQTLEFSGTTITGATNNATIVQADVPACESIVHVIDTVLVPDFNAVAPPSGAPVAASSR